MTSPQEANEGCETKDARIKELEEALRPFVSDRMPSTKRSEISFNERGLRCLMSPMQIARKNARQALKEQS